MYYIHLHLSYLLYTGRILNRFSRDIGQIDDMLPMTFYDFLQCALMCLAAIGVVAAGTPFILLALLPLTYYFYQLRRLYIRSSREIKRIEAMSRYAQTYIRISSLVVSFLIYTCICIGRPYTRILTSRSMA